MCMDKSMVAGGTRHVVFIGINSARIYFSGTNLLTWAAYDQYDPELNGIVSYFTPPLKTFAFGLELKF